MRLNQPRGELRPTVAESHPYRGSRPDCGVRRPDLRLARVGPVSEKPESGQTIPCEPAGSSPGSVQTGSRIGNDSWRQRESPVSAALRETGPGEFRSLPGFSRGARFRRNPVIPGECGTRRVPRTLDRRFTPGADDEEPPRFRATVLASLVSPQPPAPFSLTPFSRCNVPCGWDLHAGCGGHDPARLSA